jgi:hypothetical protein
VPASSDLQQAERHLAAGRLAEALALTGERLLPRVRRAARGRGP